MKHFRWVIGCCLSVAMLLPVPFASADGTKISVSTNVRSFARFGNGDLPSGLTFLGGLTLTSDNEDFGGFSGLEVSRDGKRFISVSDRGHWLTGGLVYEDGRLKGISNPRLAPILNRKGTIGDRESGRDAEAVAAWSSKGLKGKMIVGFERRERVERFNIAKHGFKAKAKRIKSPKALSQGQRNGELEALGRFSEGPLKGWLIAISERNHAKDDSLRGWLWRKGKTREFHIPRHEDYLVTGLAILPGGREIITVERSFKPPVLVGMTLRRFSIEDLQSPNTGAGIHVFSGKLTSYQIDNMEGIAAHQDDRGTVITLISDDNFNRSVQSTVMFQFRLN
ncbi:MAG: esterase-like activity of phytase family protein [Anderseniella sp.]